MAQAGARRREARRPGSQAALRRQNTQRILEALAQGGPSTQAKLARATGLSTGTISNIVKELSSQSRISSRPVIDSGRRAIEIALHDSRVSIGIDVDPSAMRIAMTRLDHSMVAEFTTDLPQGHSPVDTLRAARRMIDGVLAAQGITSADVIGAGVSIPMIMDEGGLPLVDDPTMPHWYGHDLQELAANIFPFPVQFENDANTQALAHITWGPWSRHSLLLAVKIDSGIGAGIVANGSVLRGARGAAGELGHLPVRSPGRPCHCGNRGCLETVAAVPQVLAEVRRARHDRTIEVEDVVALARRRDTATMRILEDCGAAVGTALGHAVSLLNPHAIVISGPLAAVGPSLLDPIRIAVARTAHPALGPHAVVSASQLGARAEALGAASLAASRVAAHV